MYMEECIMSRKKGELLSSFSLADEFDRVEQEQRTYDRNRDKRELDLKERELGLLEEMLKMRRDLDEMRAQIAQINSYTQLGYSLMNRMMIRIDSIDSKPVRHPFTTDPSAYGKGNNK